MTNRFITIDLAGIDPPPIIEPLDFEIIRSQVIQDVTDRLNAAGVAYDVGVLETDPFVFLCESWGARELNLRARINDAVKAVLLSSSWNGNLDQVGALLTTQRQIVNGVLETDESYRRRIQLAPEAFSTAGPEGAYVYFALQTLGPEGAIDASAVMVPVVTGHPGGGVLVTVLMGNGVYQPTAAQISKLTLVFRGAQGTNLPASYGNDSIPLTDVVSVAGPKVISVPITAVLTLYPGPETSVVVNASNAALAKLLASQNKLGRSLSRSEIMQALQSTGVFSVNLISPAQDVLINETQVIKPIDVSVTVNPKRQT